MIRDLSFLPPTISNLVAESSVGKLLLYTSLFSAVISGLLLTIIYYSVLLVAHVPRQPLESEEFYRTVTPDGAISEPLPLSSLREPAETHLSVVIPAYNESGRIESMLSETFSFLETYLPESSGKAWEVIVVDDGSADDTSEVALRFAQARGETSGRMRVCTLAKNRGKGGAVNHGMMHARGRYILFADADGASQFSDLDNLLGQLQKVERNGRGIAVGSRAHMLKTEAVVKRSYVRNFMMHGFHSFLYVFGIRSVRDTQCGFKLFTRKAAVQIFPNMHNEGWIFDVEILILAERKRIPIVEVPISWHEVPGSKMELAKDSIQMAVDLVSIRMAYVLGIYHDGWHLDEVEYVSPAEKKKQ
ncbi:nucleotide-diphospho-sugar transferase [Dipodascopsis tothii]|uniref:nucleotide-diphospho-sugar transferase n=1 Tax=Dipodascopsis tothii TaxID=44089 RepID=UPI0034CEDB0A